MGRSSQVQLRPTPWPDSPRGVVHLHGAFLFGSCPSRHYAPLLDALLQRGYGAVLHRFPLNPGRFDHWSVALELLLSRRTVLEQVRRLHGPAAAEFCADPSNSCWLGHSLGCKYLILLEILSLPRARLQQVLEDALEPAQAESVLNATDRLGAIDTLQNQPTVLLAPEVSNTMRFWRSDWQLDFGRSRPNRQTMGQLLRLTPDRFGLTGVVSFRSDGIAADDVQLLRAELQRRSVAPLAQQELPGGHFAPVALHVEALADTIAAGYGQLRSRLGATTTRSERGEPPASTAALP